MDSSTNENNGNVVQVTRQSSITNNKTILLTRLHHTMIRGNAAVPVATAVMVPLPHFSLVAPITQQEDMMGGPQV